MWLTNRKHDGQVHKLTIKNNNEAFSKPTHKHASCTSQDSEGELYMHIPKIVRLRFRESASKPPKVTDINQGGLHKISN